MSNSFGIPLATEQLIDCMGQTTHRLTLEIDGTVTIKFESSGIEARYDPSTDACLTPGVTIPQVLIDHAKSMRLH